MTLSHNPSVKPASPRNAVLEPLVQLFIGATAMRIAVLVTSLGGASRARVPHRTTIEFGTARIVIFPTELPLEIDDRLHLENADGSLSTDANVVAVQYDDHTRGIAAQFVGEVKNWILQA